MIMADDYGTTRKPSTQPLEIQRRQAQALGQMDLRATVLQCLQQLQVSYDTLLLKSKLCTI